VSHLSFAEMNTAAVQPFYTFICVSFGLSTSLTSIREASLESNYCYLICIEKSHSLQGQFA